MSKINHAALILITYGDRLSKLREYGSCWTQLKGLDGRSIREDKDVTDLIHDWYELDRECYISTPQFFSGNHDLVEKMRDLRTIHNDVCTMRGIPSRIPCYLAEFVTGL